MKLNKIFTEHMVLPSGKVLRFWGEGDGEAEIIFAGIKKNIISNTGKWFVEFPAMEYGGPFSLEFTTDGETTVIDDIYVGEVYLFAGQSNMALSMQYSKTPKEMYENNDMLRIFRPTKILKDGVNFDDAWTIATSENVATWSTIAYIAGSRIQKKKNIAVGIITVAQGASVIETFVPPKTFENMGIFLTASEKFAEHYEHDSEKFYWNKEGFLYDNAVCAIAPFPLTGAVWYQGESDASVKEGSHYLSELKTLIDIWRRDFMNDSLPFVVVQLPDCFAETGREPEAWRLIQQAQLDIEAMTQGVKTVVSRDLCESDDIHPKTKHLLGRRVADALMTITEG